jgi:hypothetical protein
MAGVIARIWRMLFIFLSTIGALTESTRITACPDSFWECLYTPCMRWCILLLACYVPAYLASKISMLSIGLVWGVKYPDIFAALRLGLFVEMTLFFACLERWLH